MSTNQEFIKQEKIIHWLNENLACVYTLNSRKLQLAHLCFDLAIEHHAAICLLYKSELYGSLLSLLRVEFETCVNGLWLYHVADERQIQKYEKDNLNLGFGAKINMIENRLGVTNSPLNIIKSKYWSIFCEFTHGGYQSLTRRSNETHTGAVNYEQQEITSALIHAGLFSMVSGVQLATMTGNNTLINESLTLYKLYSD